MKSETIYEIMLSVLAGEATGDEHRLLNEWLARSEANKREFEQMSKLYRSFEAEEEEEETVRLEALVVLRGFGRCPVYGRVLFYGQAG